MITSIGQALAESRSRLAAATCIALAVVATDFFLVSHDLWNERGALPLISVVALLEIVHGDRSSLGFRIIPVQGWAYWVRFTFWLGIAAAIALTAWAGMLMAMGYELPVFTIPPTEAGVRFWQMCVYSPVLEESIYRLAVCTPLVIMLRRWGAIATSGVLFGLLHFAYGNPSPENTIGGFILAWAFLKSGSIYVPVMLHSVGNFCVFAGPCPKNHCGRRLRRRFRAGTQDVVKCDSNRGQRPLPQDFLGKAVFAGQVAGWYWLNHGV